MKIGPADAFGNSTMFHVLGRCESFSASIQRARVVYLETSTPPNAARFAGTQHHRLLRCAAVFYLITTHFKELNQAASFTLRLCGR